MCGLTGFLDLRRPPVEALEATLAPMLESLHHRGPDDEGTWCDAETGIALGLRRLSIIDLSPSGHQPMRSASGRLVMVFNGELYNFRELRTRLAAEGCRFRGTSDTEVVLEAIEAWGLRPAIDRFNGMFAFAVWDRSTRTLHLGRDRFGEKPLYYGWLGDSFAFGSEIKTFRAHPEFRPDIDRDALSLFMRHKYVPAPYSIHRGIRKLPPGTVLSVCSPGRGETPVPIAYWTLRDAVGRAALTPFAGDDAEAADELEALLGDAVGLRMYADVPMGAFLSGGIDSSTIVALMQARAGTPIRTFTIASTEPGYDEAADARAVARHLGTDHTEIAVTPEDARAVIPELPRTFDEPFADSSQIPTLLVSRLAVDSVTVALSGDGGDEVFGGYNRYFWAPKIWERVHGVPPVLRRAAARGLNGLRPGAIDRLAGLLGSLAPAEAGRRAGEKAQKLAGVLGEDSLQGMYLGLVSHWRDPARLVSGAVEPPTPLTDPSGVPTFDDPVDRMMYLDAMTYLPDDILAKVDRASMAASLEARVPFLDHRVVEFAWSLPRRMKVDGGRGKLVLRRVLRRHVPDQLVERPKTGFGVPIGEWLRGPLRPWAEDLLDPTRMRREGFLDADIVRRTWQQHVSGRRNQQYLLWDVLMFQAWLEAGGATKLPLEERAGAR
jgi:asparagine synthase (glutamine-hydrolysing)